MQMNPFRWPLATSVTVLAGLALIVGCTPLPDAPPVEGDFAPTISYFKPATTPGTSPALVTLTWSVDDVNGDDVTCTIDVDGDDAPEFTINSCQGTGSRNVTLAAVGGVSTQHTLTLTATDGVEVDGVVRVVEQHLTVTIAPGPTEPFDITLEGVDELAPDVAATFATAAARWQQVITAGLPDVDGSDLGCTAPDGQPLPSDIDDLVIYVKVEPIDGPGSVLGSAGPTCMLMSTELGVAGEMTFDSADIATMQTKGTFGSVILHEMGHVLGIGTLWDTSWANGNRHLLTGAGGVNPRFVGAAATSEWSLLGGVSTVPVENTGGSGTADSHWRENVFTTELMTGWMNSGAKMSAMTIASLADMGYHVDLSKAEPFILGAVVSDGTASRGSNVAENNLTMLRPPLQVG